MNRISHFLRAKTQYNLHSPFAYRLYTEVLFSYAPGRRRSAEDVRWRLERYYGSTFIGDRLNTADGVFLVVDHPHKKEDVWNTIVAGTEWQTTFDLYSCGIAVQSSKLSKQHFLLR